MSARKSLSLFGVLVTVLAVAGATAYACTNLATLNLSAATGKAGDTITVTGSSFRMPSGVETGVQLRWNGTDGPVLAETRPDRVGNISAQVQIPQAAPDSYVIVAVLRDAKGADTSGTPARAQFQIVGGAGRAAPSATGAQAPVTATSSSGASSTSVALLLLLGAAGLGLFGAGFVAVARQARGQKAPAAAPVRRD